METFTAVIHREGKFYVADCPEVGTVSQGFTLEEALSNLREATELYLGETSNNFQGEIEIALQSQTALG